MIPSLRIPFELTGGVLQYDIKMVSGATLDIFVYVKENGVAKDITGTTWKLKYSDSDRSDDRTWQEEIAGAIVSPASGGIVKFSVASNIVQVGNWYSAIDATTGTPASPVYQLRGRVCVMRDFGGGVIPGPNAPMDWAEITMYSNTATHGPVRAGTGITNTVNGDGSNTHSVSYGATAGTAAQGNDARLSDSRTPTAHASTHGTGGSDPVTAADVDTAGTAIAAALGAKANLTGGNTFDASAQILGLLQALASTGMFVRDASGNLILTIGNQTPGARAVRVQGVLETSGGVTLGTNVGTSTGSVNAASIVQLRPVSGTGGIVESLVGGENLILRGRTVAAPTGNIILGGLGEYAAIEILRALNASLPFHDSSGNEHAVLTSTGLRIRPRVVSSNITAELDGIYYGVATATYTDPAPVAGRGYVVRVINGTATVGGDGYAVEGTVISREYHSGAWRNRVLFGGADAAAVRGAIGAQATLTTATESEMRAGTETAVRAVSPLNVMTSAQFAAMSPYFAVHRLGANLWSQAVVGSGATSRTETVIRIETGTTANSVGRAFTYSAYFLPTVGGGVNVNWARPFMISAFLGAGANSTTNGVRRFAIKNSADANGNLSGRGVGIKIVGGGASAQFILCVHNGTTYAESSAVTGTAVANTMFPVLIYSDGAGNVSAWFGSSSLQITGTPSVTMTGGPTTIRTGFNDQWDIEAQNLSDTANHRFELYQLKTLGL